MNWSPLPYLAIAQGCQISWWSLASYALWYPHPFEIDIDYAYGFVGGQAHCHCEVWERWRRRRQPRCTEYFIYHTLHSTFGPWCAWTNQGFRIHVVWFRLVTELTIENMRPSELAAWMRSSGHMVSCWREVGQYYVIYDPGHNNALTTTTQIDVSFAEMAPVKVI